MADRILTWSLSFLIGGIIAGFFYVLLSPLGNFWRWAGMLIIFLAVLWGIQLHIRPNQRELV